MWYHLATDPILEGAWQRGYLDVEAAAGELAARHGLEADPDEIVSAIRRYDPERRADLRAVQEAFAAADVVTREGLTRVVLEGSARSDERTLSAFPSPGDEQPIVFHSPTKRGIETIFDAEAEDVGVATDHEGVSVEGGITQLQIGFPAAEGAQDALALCLAIFRRESIDVRTVTYARPTFSAFVPSAELPEARAALRELGVHLEAG